MKEDWLRKEMISMVECYRHGNQSEGKKRFNGLIKIIMKSTERTTKPKK